jgi:tetratricopeptide (TPR) repeat protein/MFS family permease
LEKRDIYCTFAFQKNAFDGETKDITMEMKKYLWANNILGWIVFAIAATVYLLTIEPSASFWDCGEFIVSAYKLEVGHPPGAPIFMLMGNLASHLASDPSQVSLMLNALSAVFSALTILFLFWTITHLMRKIVMSDALGKEVKEMTLARGITTLGAGLVGALAYTFSDTFWFSAVESEVYAFSSLMTAVVFWLVLKWEDASNEPHSDRWLILIAYLIGVSIAIHLLNLLCIPAIVLVYYFRRTANPTWKGAAVALLVSFGILVAILYGLVQGSVEVAGWFELLFVNKLHLPYNSGVVFYLMAVGGVLVWAIGETMRKNYRSKRAKMAFLLSVALLGIPFIGNGVGLGIVIIIALSIYLFGSKKINPVALNSILIGLLVITIGYSSYALIVIRSAANTPMDQNSPEDIFTLSEYLGRKQYGETPLFYGQTFVSEVKYENKGGKVVPVLTDEGPIWGQVAKHDPSEPDRYYEVERKQKLVHVDELNMLFPRMYSSTDSHAQGYREWSNFKGRRVRISTPWGPKWVMKPTFAENVRFFFNYQVNFMYWRYFMWNFSGRQNDIQSQGEISNGNWITGIPVLDQPRVGPQDDMPDSIAKNKGHNKYYMLPLLLGLIGIFFQVYSGKKGVEQFWVTFLLFVMMGLAVVVYLNQPPGQPRERDYAYAGSFYAFCIWIGIGIGGIIHGLRRLKLSEPVAATMGAAIGLLVPLQMVSQTWDDHDRSGRYVTRDFGMNYLTTCEPNAIIFTNGDNDTFPLWYAQEVEGYRTDVRVCNLSYLQTDWYIDQMKRQAYDSEPLPIDWKKYEYVRGKHEGAYVLDEYSEMTVDRVLNRIKSEDIRDKRLRKYNVEADNVPTHNILIPVDSAAVIASGLVKPEHSAWIPPYMTVYLGEQRNENGEVTSGAKSNLGKHELMVLDMLKNNSDWKRPIYFATTVGPEMFMRLDPYFRQDGVAYRIVPYDTSNQRIDADILYDNVMNKYKFGNLEKPGLYLDENCIRLASTFRLVFGRLAQALANQGDSIRAEEVVDRSLKVIPAYNVPYDYFYGIGDLVDVYNKIGAREKAGELYRQLAEISIKNLNWYSRLNTSQLLSVWQNVRRDALVMQIVIDYFSENNPDLFETYSNEYTRHIDRISGIARTSKAQPETRQGGPNR